MPSKVELLSWYLQHPAYYVEMGRHAMRRLRTDKNELRKQKQASIEWCEANAVTANQVVEAIVPTYEFVTFSEKFPELVEAGWKTIQKFPTDGKRCAGDLDLIYNVTGAIGASRVIETGVAAGWSSLAILLAISSKENARLISTDLPYAFDGANDYVGCVVPKELAARWTLIRLADREGLPSALGELPVIDLCHYDSDKSFEGRMWAYPKLWDALVEGGVFLSDDIDDNLAFRDFAQAVKRKPFVIASPATNGIKYVGAIVK